MAPWLTSLLLLAAPAAALDGLRVSGNVKEIYWQSRTVLDDKPYTHNLTRASLVVDAKKDLFAAHVDYRHELRFGSYFETNDYRTFGLGEAPFFLHMENRIDQGERWQWNQGVYRGWAGLESERVALRFGRQRIAWGTGKLWNPTDVLNPYQPISVERIDRRGVDAAYFRLAIRELTQFEMVYAPQDNGAETQFLERFRTHFGKADVSVMGGKAIGHKDAWMIGGDLAMDLFDGNLHGEITQTDPWVADPYTRWLAGYEYRIPPGQRLSWLDDLWLLAEYYHNGSGATDPALYDFVAVLSGRAVNMGREYVGAGLQKELSPLWNVEVYAIRNLKDRSMFIGPALEWNAMEDLDLLVGSQIFTGEKTSEYGRLSPIYYFQAQVFFGS